MLEPQKALLDVVGPTYVMRADALRVPTQQSAPGAPALMRPSLWAARLWCRSEIDRAFHRRRFRLRQLMGYHEDMSRPI